MKTLHGLESLEQPLSHSVLTIGNFDGVHRAHQQILAQAGLFAANTGGPVVVLTFEPHPLNIVSPDHAPPRLTTPEQKLNYLAAAGADVTVVAVSKPSLLGMEAERFVEEVIIDRFHPSHIVEGPSFGFGKGRKGTPELLRKIAGKHACEVHIVEPVTLQIDEGETLMVSSSIIRKLVIEGRVRRASLCLGRRYELLGTVVEGDRRGRTLGFPTANLGDVQSLTPGDGVFSGRVFTEGKAFAAAISIGRNATFGGGARRVEAHLLDFDGDLYGQPIRVEFQRRLRKHTKFDSPEKLIEQLHRDVEDVRASGT